MSATIAVVDDEPDLREAIVEYLQGHGFRVMAAETAAAFRALIAQEPVDLVILDINMPGEDGLSLARWLRKHSETGIIFASAAGHAIDRIVGLEIGADDYLVKPYDLREMLARIRSVLRRLQERPHGRAKSTAPTNAAAVAPAGRRIQFGDFVLDLDGRRLSNRDGTPVDLTPLEFDLLETLAQRPNRVLSRAVLIEQSRDGAEMAGDDRRIDIRITRLRKKIEPEPDRPRFIRTVRGEGYVFVPQLDEPVR
jgi:DNA-binding response OmpR family regulator